MNPNTNLAAVLMTNITDPDEITDLTLAVLIYSDGSGRVKFPSGNSMYFRGPEGSTVQDALKVSRWQAQLYAASVGQPQLVITEHIVPDHLDEPDLLAWVEDIGLEIVAIDGKPVGTATS